MGQINTTSIAIIPARSGSKGIPGKNIFPVSGKPLIQWTIEAALKSTAVDRVIVSTNDEKIRDISIAAGAQAPFLRPAELADDTTHAVYAVLHALDWLQQNEHDGMPTHVIMLLPTAPLRTHEHIDEAMEIHMNNNNRSVIGVMETSFELRKLRIISNGRLTPLDKSLPLNTQRQENAPIFQINGCIHVSSSESLVRHQTFHTDDAMPYIMPEDVSIDVDTMEDMKKCEQALQQQHWPS